MGYYTIHTAQIVICKPIEVMPEGKVSPFINFSEAPDKIKQHYVLSRYIEDSGVELKRQGREAVGLCPFKAEKTPSFSVNDEKGVYLCRGCGATGDIITYVSESTGVSQGRAIRTLAEAMGYQIRSEDRQGREVSRKPSATANKASREAMIEVHDHVAQVAHAYLLEILEQPEHPVTRYLQERGLERSSVELFGLGYLPSDVTLWEHVSRASSCNSTPTTFGPQHWRTLAQESGLLGNRHQVSMFQGRLLFPIVNGDGCCVAFSGRVIPSISGQAVLPDRKYLNSPETFIFTKSRVLFGLTPWHASFTHDGVRERWRNLRGAGRVVTVEGVTDVLRLALLGVWSVASLGTAISEFHLDLLFRAADTVCLLTDGDSAGEAAAQKGLLLGFSRLKAGKRIYAATLPQGEDPDTYFRELADCPDSAAHFWHLTGGLSHSHPEQVWFDQVIGKVDYPVSLGDRVLIDQAVSEDAPIAVPADPLWRVAVLRFLFEKTGYSPAVFGCQAQASSVHPDNQRQWLLDDSAKFWLYRVARAPHILPLIAERWLDTWWGKDVVAGLLASGYDCPPALQVIIYAAGILRDGGVTLSADSSWRTLADALLENGCSSSLLISWSAVLADGDQSFAALGYGEEALVPDLWVAEFDEWARSIDSALSQKLAQAIGSHAGPAQ